MSGMTVRDIVNMVAEESGVSVHDIFSGGREKSVVTARNAVYIVLRELFGMSYPECAKALGRSCHTSVMNACKFRRARSVEIAETVKSKLKLKGRNMPKGINMEAKEMIEWAEQRASDHETDEWRMRHDGRPATADGYAHMAATARAVAEYIRRKEATK